MNLIIKYERTKQASFGTIFEVFGAQISSFFRMTNFVALGALRSLSTLTCIRAQIGRRRDIQKAVMMKTDLYLRLRFDFRCCSHIVLSIGQS